MTFFQRLIRAGKRLWHDVPPQDMAIAEQIAEQAASKALLKALPHITAQIDKATKTPLATIGGAIVENQIAQNDAAAQVKCALQGGQL